MIAQPHFHCPTNKKGPPSLSSSWYFLYTSSGESSLMYITKHKAFWYMKHYDIIHRIHNNYKKKSQMKLFDYHKYYYILMYVKVILWQSYKSFECQFHVNHIRWIQFYGYKILSLCKISMRINMFYNKIHFSDSKIKV